MPRFATLLLLFAAASAGAQTAPLPACADPRPRQPDAELIGLQPSTIAFSSKCEWLVVGGHNGMVQVIDRSTGKLRAQVKAHDLRVQRVLLTPDDKFLFTTKMVHGEVAIWSAPALEPIGRFQIGDPGSAPLAYDSANRILITGASDNIQGWKIGFSREGIPAQPLFTARAKSVIHSIALSPDGKFIAAGGSGALNLWRYEGANPRVVELAAIQPYEPPEWILGTAFSRDGRALVTVMRPPKKQIAVWRVPTLDPFPISGNDPGWEMVTEPGKVVVRANWGYKGPDKSQLSFELDGNGADSVYANLAGTFPTQHAAFRGQAAVSANHNGVAFWNAFGPPGRDPVLTVRALPEPRKN